MCGLKIPLLGGLIILYINSLFPYKGIEWILYNLQNSWVSENFGLISKSQSKSWFGVILHLGVSNFLLSLGLKFWNPGLTMSQIYHSTPPDFVQ